MNEPCSQPSGDESPQTTSAPVVAPGNENGLAVPVPLRKSRPVSMDARIQVAQEKQVAEQGGDLSPAANRSQKTSQSRPNSSALETLGGEKLANGSLEPPPQAAPGPSKRDSDCSSLCTSESMDYGTNLSADLSLNKEMGSLSIKVTPPLPPRACSETIAGCYAAPFCFQKRLGASLHFKRFVREFWFDSWFNLQNIWVQCGI